MYAQNIIATSLIYDIKTSVYYVLVINFDDNIINFISLAVPTWESNSLLALFLLAERSFRRLLLPRGM